MIQVLVQIPAGTCMYPGRCRYLPWMWIPIAQVGSSMAQMMGMDLWPRVPVLTDVDVSRYAIVKISISNGPVHLSSSFFFGRERCKFVVSSQTLSPTLYSIAGHFFLSYCAFICKAAFSSDHLAAAWISYILEMKAVEAGVQKGTAGLVPGRIAGLYP